MNGRGFFGIDRTLRAVARSKKSKTTSNNKICVLEAGGARRAVGIEGRRPACEDAEAAK